MGDRISISFKSEYYGESVWMYSHWYGLEFLGAAKEFISETVSATAGSEITPQDRMEPMYLVPMFVEFIAQNHPEMLWMDICQPGHGDDGDNGHWTFDIDTNTWLHEKREDREAKE